MNLKIHPIIAAQKAFGAKDDQLRADADKLLNRMKQIATEKKSILALSKEFNIRTNNADSDGLNYIDFTEADSIFKDNLDALYAAGYFKDKASRAPEERYTFQGKEEIDAFLAEIEEIKSNLQDETSKPQANLMPLLNLMQLMNEIHKKITESDEALKSKINSNLR